MLNKKSSYYEKILLCLSAFLLSIAVTNAQEKFTPGNNVSQKLVKRSDVAGFKSEPLKNKANQPNKIALEEGERIVGYYTTDDLDLSGTGGLGVPNAPGKLEAGVALTPNELGKAVGGQITKVRFGLACSVGASKVSIYPLDLYSGQLYQSVSEQEVSTTVEGWNDVTLSTPVTIEDGMSYLISFEYIQKSTNTAESYPLLTDGKFTSNIGDYGFMIYGDLNKNNQPAWFTMSPQYGNLCIQAVVKGGSYSDDDISIVGGVPQTIYQKGGNMDVSMSLKDLGNKQASSYTLNVELDNNVVEQLKTPVALSSQAATYTYTFKVPEDLSVAEPHKLTISVADINGTKPTVNTDDDSFSIDFNVYGTEDVVGKQKTLVEQFTSAGCPNCPYGYNFLNALNAKRNDLAWVAIHTDFGSVKDDYTTTEGDNLVVLEVSVFPSASFNRAYIAEPNLNSNGTTAINIGINDSYVDSYSTAFSNMIDNINSSIPAFASVNIATTYDKATKKLKINVSGEGNNNVKSILKDDVVCVYLTEDGLTGLQLSGSNRIPNYPHDHVLRDVVSANFGDAINWTGANTYSNEYEVTLDNSWNADNMNVIAFISRPVKIEGNYITSNVNDVWVSNTNMVKVGETTGIQKPVITTGEVKEVARYAIDGTQLNAPAKGINIVKMSDGTTRKVVVE